MNVKNPQLIPTSLVLILLIMTAGCGRNDHTSPSPPATLTAISIWPVNPSIATGTTQQFTAVGTYSNGSGHIITSSVTWTSSNTAVADISNTAGSKGLAMATTTTGVAIITATYSGITRTTALTVLPVASLAVTPTNPPSIAPGTTVQFAAIGTLGDKTVQTLTTWATWNSSDTAIATFSNLPGSKGLATATFPSTGGTASATITASYSGVSGTATIMTSTLLSIGVTPTTISIPKGTTLLFIARGTLADATIQDLTTAATWSTSNSGVATISNALGSQGIATAVNEGTVTILSSFTGVTSSPATLFVTPAVLSSMTVTPTNPSIALGKTKQFTAIGRFSDTTEQNLTSSVAWSSTNATVATISNTAGSNGLATSKNEGITSIRATSGSISAQTTLTVTPVVLESILVTPVTATVFNGMEKQFNATGIYTDGFTQDLTTSVVWHSSDITVAYFNNVAGRMGIAVATFTDGTTLIAATMSGITSNAAILTVQ